MILSMKKYAQIYFPTFANLQYSKKTENRRLTRKYVYSSEYYEN